MCSAIFSDFGTTSAKNYSNFSAQTQNNQPKKQENKTIDKLKKAAPVIIPLAAIPVTALITYKVSTKNMAGLTEQLSGLTKEVAKLKESSATITEGLKNQVETTAGNDSKIWTALIAAAGLAGTYKAGELSQKDKNDVSNAMKQRVDLIDETSKTALSDAQKSGAASSSLMRKYTGNFYGINLLNSPSIISKNNNKYSAAIQTIKTAASKRLYDTPENTPITKDNPTVWSITSEFAPVKEGGLGSVPVAIQDNLSKLGVNNPTFLPMYQQPGQSIFKKVGTEYIYKYKNKMEIRLKKLAAFQTDVYRNGQTKTEDVEFYVANLEKDSTKPPRQLIFVKNDNYFDGTIYQAGTHKEEPEKFAFFSKAVYEFAKMKMDINSVKNPVIPNKKIYDSVKEPDCMILNDWQAGPFAALARYKAPMENAFGQLNDESAKKLSEMRLIGIGHNTMYQGSTQNNNDSSQQKEATANVLNTLFDDYAYDIVSNAKSGASDWNSSDDGLRNLDYVLLTDTERPGSTHTNLLNMGVCLSDYFHPVSKNYAEEILSDEHADLSGELRWALNRKNEAGSLVGIINGNDFNRLSVEAKKDDIKEITNIDYKTYNKASDIDDIINAKKANKIAFYNDYMKPFTLKNDPNNNDEKIQKIRELSGELEFVEAKGRTKALPDLSDVELANTPVITSVGRLVSQKGVDVLCDAIKMLMDNWENDFGDKPKPIFYIAGQDAENGKQRAYVQQLQDKKLSKEDANRVVFAHGMAPMTAMAAASDFFLLPSNFEPCGLTQSEAFAVATPVIGSSVGGIVDTVNRNGKHNGILTEPEIKLSAKNFYDAMKKGLEIYFNKPDKYKNMVKDAISEDFSWIQKDKQGPVFEYLNHLGIDTEKLPEVA